MNNSPPPAVPRLPKDLERLILDFRYCALSDTCVDDLSPYTEAALDALRLRIAALISEARAEGEDAVRRRMEQIKTWEAR